MRRPGFDAPAAAPGAARAAALAAALVAALAFPAPAQEPFDPWRAPVVKVSVTADGPVDEARLVRLSGIEPGAPLTEPVVRRALRNLFATGLFADLAVEAAPAAGGAAVTVTGALAPRVDSVELSGVEVPARGALLRAFATRAGDPWSAETAAQGREAVLAALKARGYLDGRVAVNVAPGATETSVRVAVEVTAGRPARPGAPAFSGSLGPLRPEELAKAGKAPRASVYREAVARDDAQRYEDLLHSRGHARAEVRFDSTEYDPGRAVAVPRYNVFAGPRVVLEVEGEKPSAVRGHPASPWERGEPPDEDAVRKLAAALRDDLQRKGYARATVEPSFATAPGEERITIEVRKGARYVLSGVRFDSAPDVPQKELRRAVATRPRGLLDSGRAVDSVLASDREAIAALFRGKGYPDARVPAARVEDSGVPFELLARFRVDEGRRAVVAAVSVLGAEGIPWSELAPLLSVRAGQPFRQADVDADASVLATTFGDRGYSGVRVDPEVAFADAGPDGPRQATVTFRVTRGRRSIFGKTIVRGNRATRTSVLERELTTREGEPFSFSRLVETQQALTRLGLFSRVDVEGLPEDPDTTARTVLVTVAEGSPWSLTYGIGAEYDSGADPRFNPRLSLGVSYANLLGRAITADLDARYSRRDTRLLVRFRERSLFDWGVPLTLTIFNAIEIRPSYEVDRKGFYLETERRLSTQLKATLRYQYEIVNPTGDPGTDRQNQRNFISSIGPGVVLDTRDDPIVPRRGVFLSSDLKWASPLLTADADFVKLFGQATLYTPFRSTTFVLSFRAGAIANRKACEPDVNPSCLPNLEVPVVERFYAGGRSSHRAFSLDNLGIEGQTLSDGVGQGGNAILVGNAEWRIPLAGSLGVAVFVDAGNVWSEPARIRLGDIRVGAGLGLSYMTPVGPVRLEYGVKLDRQPGESAGEVSFSIGYPF